MQKGKMLSTMLKIATNAHHGQFDRGGQPYILHVLKVMHYLKTDDEELQCIALGHDLIEDAGITYQELRDAGISDRVLEGIDALTKRSGQTLEDYKAGVFDNVDAMRVKLCDLRHNSDIRRLKGISEKDFDRMKKYHQFFLEIKERLNEA
jgi:(p)ppGpp synthase/HD superfamily hydrolase